GGVSWIMKIGIGVLLTWIGLNSKNTSMSFSCIAIGIITLYLGVVVQADMGCVINWKGKELKCGSGIFVTCEVHTWTEQYKFQADSPKRLATAIAGAWENGVGGIRSTTRMENLL
ncbi:hypothetical protein CV015_01020, partial [Staphylococcus haemolyticus]